MEENDILLTHMKPSHFAIGLSAVVRRQQEACELLFAPLQLHDLLWKWDSLLAVSLGSDALGTRNDIPLRRSHA